MDMTVWKTAVSLVDTLDNVTEFQVIVMVVVRSAGQEICVRKVNQEIVFLPFKFNQCKAYLKSNEEKNNSTVHTMTYQIRTHIISRGIFVMFNIPS